MVRGRGVARTCVAWSMSEVGEGALGVAISTAAVLACASSADLISNRVVGGLVTPIVCAQNGRGILQVVTSSRLRRLRSLF